MFRFRPETSQKQKELFKTNIKTLKSLSCVKDNRLIVGGPSITDPLSRSQGYHFCLVSYHQNHKALEEYQASKEHHEYVICHASVGEFSPLISVIRSVTARYMWPYIDDVHRFDFEVDPEDEYMVGIPNTWQISSTTTPAESESGCGSGQSEGSDVICDLNCLGTDGQKDEWR